MKKLLILLLSLIFVFPAFADTTIVGGGTGSGVQTDSDCDQSKYYPTGTLCQDTDDYKLYKGIGTGIQEIAAGGTGDVTGPAGGVTDADLAGFSGTTGKIIKKITALPDGTTATTQTAADGSTKVATTLYVDTAVSGASGGYADPDANTISMWDDTDGAFFGAVIGSGLSYDHASHILSVSASGDAAADGVTKGISAFTANDFNASSGVVSLDYTNGQKATGSVPGFLSSTDWTTFNNKQATITRPVSGPASATTGNLAVYGADSQTLADGGAPFNPAVPGTIGGTTPAAVNGTLFNVTGSTPATTGLSKDGSNNLVLTDAVTGSKKLSDLIPGSAPNLALSAGQVPFTADGVNLTAITMDTDLSSVSANDDTFPSAKATKAMGDLKLTIAVPAVVDGSAEGTMTATQMSDPRCRVSNYGQADAAHYVTLPAAAANLSCLFVVETARAQTWGVKAGAGDGIRIVAADGTIGDQGSDAGYALLDNAVIGQSFACWSLRTGASAYDWECKAIALGTGRTFTTSGP